MSVRGNAQPERKTFIVTCKSSGALVSRIGVAISPKKAVAIVLNEWQHLFKITVSMYILDVSN